MIRCCLVVLASSLLAVGCTKTSATYCADHPDDTVNCTDPDGGVDVPCTTDDQCLLVAAPVCEPTAMVCVQCTMAKHDACKGTTPVCDDATNRCEGCTAHDQCASKVCLPDGSCAAEADVAYVEANANADVTCTRTQPCELLSEGLATNRPYIKIGVSPKRDTDTTVISGKKVTIVADPGAKLDRDGDGPILQVTGINADVEIYDLEISGGSSQSGDGIDLTPSGGMPKLLLQRVKVSRNQGIGLAATGGNLTVTQSTFNENDEGGLSTTSTVAFNITNTFFVRNGDMNNSAIGGVALGLALPGMNRFEFNTVIDNRNVLGAGGLSCGASGFSAPNNIIARNFLITTPNQTTIAGCSFPTSVVQNDLTGLVLVHPDPPGTFDYRLMAGSTSAIDLATTPSGVVVDVDNDGRPQGAQKDIGADELR
jgi:hypothetical protein